MKVFYLKTKICLTIIVLTYILTFCLKRKQTGNLIRRSNAQSSKRDDERGNNNELHQAATIRDPLKYTSNQRSDMIQNSIRTETVSKNNKNLFLIKDDTTLDMAMRNNTVLDKQLLKIKAQTKISANGKLSEDEFTNPGKWTIILTVNNAFFDLFENWWWYFSKLNVTVNITVIAEDEIVFGKLTQEYKMASVFIERSWILNMSSDLFYNTPGYKKMVSARPAYIIKYLKQSINVLYVDVDTVFLKNPFQYFKGDFDMWTQSQSNANVVCSGFMAIRRKGITVNVMKEWYSQLNESLQLNQPALNRVLRKSDITINYLNEQLFVGGRKFSGMPQKQRSEVVVLHATSCLGYKQKYQCFKKWKLWAPDMRVNRS